MLIIPLLKGETYRTPSISKNKATQLLKSRTSEYIYNLKKYLPLADYYPVMTADEQDDYKEVVSWVREWLDLMETPCKLPEYKMFNNAYNSNKANEQKCRSYVPLDKRIMVCADCGQEYTVDAHKPPVPYCDDCQTKHGQMQPKRIDTIPRYIDDMARTAFHASCELDKLLPLASVYNKMSDKTAEKYRKALDVVSAWVKQMEKPYTPIELCGCENRKAEYCKECVFFSFKRTTFITCSDCGKQFEAYALNRLKQHRCAECQHEHKKIKMANYNARHPDRYDKYRKRKQIASAEENHDEKTIKKCS